MRVSLGLVIEDDLKAFEASLVAPFLKIRTGIIKGIAEFDKHIERGPALGHVGFLSDMIRTKNQNTDVLGLTE